MALEKEILQDDGVTTNYHRILQLSVTPNRQNSIEVLSYVSKQARESEKNNTMEQPYVKAITYETDYDKSMTMSKAYNYLKSLPEFNGAVDVFDDMDNDEITGEDFLAMIEEVM